jgi:hypothetical protein
MQNAVMTDELFKSEFVSHAVKPVVDNPLSIIEEYVLLRKTSCRQADKLGVGKQGIIEIKDKLIRAFVDRWMKTRYASVDTAFTDREWWLRVERNDDNDLKITNSFFSKPPTSEDRATVAFVKVKQFFNITFDCSDFVFGQEADDYEESGEFTVFRKGGSSLTSSNPTSGQFAASRKGGKTLTVMNANRVTAVLPDGINEKHVLLSHKALSHLRFASAALTAYGIDLTAELAPNMYHGNGTESEFFKIRVIWAPNIDMLSMVAEAPRPKGDPAILVELLDKTYLLDFYDTPNEAPIEHLIREFSEGKLPNRNSDV